MTITPEQLEQFIRIYNTLFQISTKGEETLIMADCLRALDYNITSIKNNPQAVDNNINTRAE